MPKKVKKNSYFFAFFPKFWQKIAKKVKKAMFYALKPSIRQKLHIIFIKRYFLAVFYKICLCSLAWQSARLVILRTGVQFPPQALFFLDYTLTESFI